MNEIEQRLQELERLGLSRRLRMVSGPQGPRVLLDGKPVLLLCSNNYLGLADHPRVREAAAEAAMRWGVGAGASRLVSGTMTIHRRLEERLAAFERSEACLLFGSGYLANVGAIGALAGPGDTVFSDELNHASIVDGCRLSRAQVVVYRHRDAEHLDWSLRRHGGSGRLADRHRLGVLDGRRRRAAGGDRRAGTAVRCAHDRRRGARHRRARPGRARGDRAGRAGGRGGRGGRHARQGARLLWRVCVRAQEMVRYLINTARPLIFSTAPPPPAIAGALAALELLRRAPPPRAAAALATRARCAARSPPKACRSEDVEMHIVPLMVGEERAAMASARRRCERGVFAQAIRPPTVATGTSRLRLTVMATHTAEELRGAARVLGEAARELGLDLAAIGDSARGRASRSPSPREPERTRASWSGRCPRWRRPRASATRSSPGAGPTGWQVPFDVERDIVDPPRGLAARARARACAGCSSPGTGTGVGKTILSAALLAAMAAAGERVRAYKPVVTGLGRATRRRGWPADHELLARVAGMAPEEVAPLRYGPAVSPHLAAPARGRARSTPRGLIARARAARRQAARHADRRGRRRPAGPAQPRTTPCAIWPPRWGCPC